MKTAMDPRPAFNNAFYAKIRILKFNVVDSAQHQIKMVFLWAFNISGLPDLTTSVLDTFHLDGSTINRANGRFANDVNRSLPRPYVFKDVGGRFILPQELVGKVKWLTVWNLRGEMLGRIGAQKDIKIGWDKLAKPKEILIVKVN